MAKVSPSSVEVRPVSADDARASLGALVMAWARDSATGQPRYIGEIDANHRGGKCGCECPSCMLPLVAVNAAKDRFIKRPHFRHPEGAQRAECSILTARAAALHLLTQDGVIELPRRRMSARAQGLSGTQHEAWVELPAQRVRIASMDFRDRTFAILTLDDGRQLRVALTGGITEEVADEAGSVLVPTITIDVPDAAIAGMDQAEIRKRLELMPERLCWRAHWSDLDLAEDAKRKATAVAVEALDWLPNDIVLPEGLTPGMQRESLLHHEVKSILASEGRFAIPGLDVHEELKAPGRLTLYRRWAVAPRVLALSNVRLEHRMRPLIPDVVCDGRADDGETFSPLIIEVTVANPIDDDRLARIRELGLPAIEIDLSLAGGIVTREQLKAMVVQEVSLKRWLHYPDLAGIRAQLQEEMRTEHDRQVESVRLAAERALRVQAMPIGDLAREYLGAVESMLVAKHQPTHSRDEGRIRETELIVASRVEEMTQRGFPEAADEALLGASRILSRLLSIRENRGIGYGHDTAAGVLNAIKQSQLGNRSDWTLYLIAVRVYLPEIAEIESVWSWYKPWRDDVEAAVLRQDQMYMRSTRYDRLLSVLFPEMASRLAKDFGKRPPVPAVRWNEAKKRFDRVISEPVPRRAGFLTALADRGLLTPARSSGSTGLQGWYLTGAALAAWKRDNPAAAADWDEVLRRDGVE